VPADDRAAVADVADIAQHVGVVTVHYRGVRDLLEMLSGLSGLPVAVVDNAGELGGLTGLPAGCRVLDSGGNVGFARAANVGAAELDRPALLFANPDSRPSPADVAALLAVLDSRPEVAAVAPAVLDEHGRARGGGGRAPSVLSALAAVLGPLAPRSWRIWTVPDGSPHEVDWLSGACVLVRRSAFVEVGGFDEHYPLYNEDMALGARLRGAGHRLVLDGRVRVAHPSGGSAEGDPSGLWAARGGALGHYVRREVRRGARTTHALLVVAFALRTAACVVTGRRAAAREWATVTRGLVRAELPVLADA